MEYNGGRDFKTEELYKEVDLGEGRKKSKAWKYIAGAGGGLAGLALLCGVSGCGGESKSEYKGVKEKPAVTEMVKKDKEKQEFGLGVDITKYVIGETKVFYVYKTFTGATCYFPKRKPKGYVGYRDPELGGMGWVPKDIEIPEGYRLVFDCSTGMLLGKTPIQKGLPVAVRFKDLPEEMRKRLPEDAKINPAELFKHQKSSNKK